jgi:2-phospho-L-lactate transferase/gluconeogenesis factor (CofD/UPF0052 family)
MKILIIAGGTGSIALQTGLYNLLDKNLDGIDTKILVNAYDNGLSTGAVRKVLDGKILGPSDVRKNQTTRLKLENPFSPWLAFLDIRFSEQALAARSFCQYELLKLQSIFTPEFVQANKLNFALVKEAIDTFFETPASLLIDYSDFSLANIVYAGFAKANGNSLRKAAAIMASILGIKDNVILNSDESLFLGAISKNGVKVRDESDIVCWGNKEDPFVDCFFTDVNGIGALPELCKEAVDAIVEADLIILSTGTPWSSLIPTYKSLGFEDAIKESKAKIIMVANRTPDKDSPGQSISELINIISDQYFGEKRIHLICDANSLDEQQRVLTPESFDRVAGFHEYQLMDNHKNSFKVHNPDRLAKVIGEVYFADYLQSEHFMFDYDDTLISRGNKLPKTDKSNTLSINKMLDSLERSDKISICTGNSIKAVNLRISGNEKCGIIKDVFSKQLAPLLIFADGGINEYLYRTELPIEKSDDIISNEFVRCIDDKSLLNNVTAENLIDELIEFGIPSMKIENRHNALISIKPIDPEYKTLVISFITKILYDNELNWVVQAAGRTTVEIKKPTLSKVAAIKHKINVCGNKTITYVGDEMNNGNDACVKEYQEWWPQYVKCLHTTGPAMTAFFLKTLENKND